MGFLACGFCFVAFSSCCCSRKRLRKELPLERAVLNHHRDEICCKLVRQKVHARPIGESPSLSMCLGKFESGTAHPQDVFTNSLVGLPACSDSPLHLFCYTSIQSRYDLRDNHLSALSKIKIPSRIILNWCCIMAQSSQLTSLYVPINWVAEENTIFGPLATPFVDSWVQRVLDENYWDCSEAFMKLIARFRLLVRYAESSENGPSNLARDKFMLERLKRTLGMRAPPVLPSSLPGPQLVERWMMSPGREPTFP